MTILEQVSLAPYTTLRVGGPARYFAVVTSTTELREAWQFATEQAVPVLVLGGGSNLLVRDAGWPGLVIKNEIRGRHYQENQSGEVISDIGAGESLDTVIAETVDRGYWGLENLSHIPGTVGATPVQNVGAYGVEVSDCIQAVDAFDLATGVSKTFSLAECQFAYRDSWFKQPAGQSWVITGVTFRLHTAPQPILTYPDLASLATQSAPTAAAIRQAVIAIRQKKFPNWQEIGTAGSFFKNPIVTMATADRLRAWLPELPVYPVSDTSVKVSLGYLLDHGCGLRGFARGAVSLSPQQALVLCNTGSEAAAIEAFVDHIAAVVLEKTGLTIEQEVRTV